jgi:hypothetical protein
MKRRLKGALLAVLLLAPSLAGAVTEEDYKIRTAQDLLHLCTVPTTDPLYSQALHFCHGYLVGALHFHLAENAGPEGKPLVCFPNPPPARNDAVSQFISWLQAHPQYLNDTAVEAEFRFLTEKWPCAKKEGSEP